uniref:SSD domain-containing protein n=1 Tax=Bursaphelenchus xylophilus TaxID=6326 RepID=A0A1I7SVM0_BURXY
MRGLGYYFGCRPVLTILCTVAVLCPFFSFFLLRPVQIVTDVRRGFAHRNGRSTDEFKAFGHFYNVSMEDMELLIILIESKNRGEKKLEMSSELLEEVVRLDAAVQATNVTARNGTHFSFKDMFTKRGSINFLFDAFKLGYDVQNLNYHLNLTMDDSIRLDSPFARIYEHEFLTLQHFFGAETWPKDNVSRVSQIKSVQSIGLWYMLQAPLSNRAGRDVLHDIELSIFEMSQKNFSKLFDFYMYADEVANHEMMVGSLKTTNLLSVGAFLMVVFMLISLRDFHLKDALVLLTAAISTPLLATLTTFSIIGWSGMPFNGVMSIAPFLILGIGVDDAFLLLHSWRDALKHMKNATPAERLERVVTDVGPSILITSVTNTLAFSVGILSPAYTMMSFCLCTTIAVALDLILEFTIFAPTLVLICPIPREKVEEPLEKLWWFKYAQFLVSKVGRGLFTVILVCLSIWAYFGIANMNPNFEPEKTFPFDSHLQESLRPIKTLYKEYGPMSIIINRAPDIRNETDLGEFFEMVETIEALNETYPSNYTQLWLRQYMKYHKAKLPNDTLTYQLVPQFLKERLMEDKNIVLYHKDKDGTVRVDSFVFLIICHGERNWHTRAFFVDEMRSLIDSYPQFQASVFDYDATIFDLIITAKVTLIGALGWWGQDMDPVTMTNVLMAIGFSVDFSAHICYHYFKQERSDARLGLKTDQKDLIYRLTAVFAHVGRPTFEAASSTMICMLPLFTVQMYVIGSFAKTVMCVGILGLLHGLFLVPSLLTLHFHCFGEKKKLKETRSTDSDRPLIITQPLI